YSVVGEEAKPTESSFEVTLNYRCGNAEQHQEYRIDRDHHLKHVVDDPKPAHERIVKQNIVVEDADYPEQLARDRHHRHSGEEQEWQEQPAQHHAHLPVEVVGQNPVGYLHRADRTNILEPISSAEIGVPARSANEGLRDEVPDRKCMGTSIVRKSV